MFSRKEKIKTASIIGGETEFKGTLKDRESIRIDGKFEGKIQVEGDVIVGKDAFVKADIQAKSITIGGKVIGNICCQGKVELSPSGSLEGKVKASDLTIAEGAFFNGECRMVPLEKSEEEKPAESDLEQTSAQPEEE